MPALSLVLIWLHLHEELLFGTSSVPPVADSMDPSADTQGASMSAVLFQKQAALWHNMAALLNGVMDRARTPREDELDYNRFSGSASVGGLVHNPLSRDIFRPKRAPLPEETLVRGFLVLQAQFSDEDASIDFTLGALGSPTAATDERCRLFIRFGRWLALRCDSLALARPYLVFDAELFEFSSALPLEDYAPVVAQRPAAPPNGSRVLLNFVFNNE